MSLLEKTDSICLVEDAPDSIITFSGTVVRPLSPDPDTLKIEDIAHALANQCRFTGHVKEFYSVAQHSVYVSRMASGETALWGLLHDASEAYLSDLARPLKYANGLGDVYREAETRLTYAIAKKFGLTVHTSVNDFSMLPVTVKEADDVMLRLEARDLMPPNFPVGEIKYHPMAPRKVSGWSPDYAEVMFLGRYLELTK